MAAKGKSIKEFFHNRGLKCTPQRLAVLSILEESPKHLSIQEIHRRVKKILPDTGLATIYRTLEILVDLGLVLRVHQGDECQNYVMAPLGHQHPLVCTDCGKVLDFAECPMEDVAQRITEQTGFSVEKHFVQLFGKCRQCQAPL